MVNFMFCWFIKLCFILCVTITIMGLARCSNFVLEYLYLTRHLRRSKLNFCILRVRGKLSNVPLVFITIEGITVNSQENFVFLWHTLDLHHLYNFTIQFYIWSSHIKMCHLFLNFISIISKRFPKKTQKTKK